MTRKRGTATKAALIASLAVAFGVGSSALATTPPSEPDPVARAANARVTSPRPRPRPRRRQPRRRRAAPGDDGRSGAGDDRGGAPATTAAPGRRPHRRRRCPANVTELDAETTSQHQPAAARQPAAGRRRCASSVGSLAENWNPNHPDGNELDFSQTSVSRWATSRGYRRRGRPHAQPRLRARRPGRPRIRSR